MLASSEVGLRALDSPRENRSLSFRGLQLTQKSRIRKPLIRPGRILHIPVLERQDSHAAQDSVRALIQTRQDVCTHHDRMRGIKRERILVLVLSLNSGRRRHLLNSAAIHHTIRKLLNVAEAHTTQGGSSLQQILPAAWCQEGMNTHVRVAAKSASNSRHEDALTIRAAASQDRQCSTTIIRLIAGEGTANPPLEPFTLSRIKGLKDLIPRLMLGARHVDNCRLLHHPVAGIM